VEFDSRVRERLDVPGEAVGGGRDLPQVAEEADPPVTRGDQVSYSGLRSAGVVGYDRVGAKQSWRAVGEHETQPGALFVGQVALIITRGDDDQAVHAPGDKSLRERAFTLGI